MSELIPFLWQAFVGLLGLLIIVLAWEGKRIYEKLDGISRTLTEMRDAAYERHANHEARIIRIETKLEIEEK